MSVLKRKDNLESHMLHLLILKRLTTNIFKKKQKKKKKKKTDDENITRSKTNRKFNKTKNIQHNCKVTHHCLVVKFCELSGGRGLKKERKKEIFLL